MTTDIIPVQIWYKNTQDRLDWNNVPKDWTDNMLSALDHAEAVTKLRDSKGNISMPICSLVQDWYEKTEQYGHPSKQVLFATINHALSTVEQGTEGPYTKYWGLMYYYLQRDGRTRTNQELAAARLGLIEELRQQIKGEV